MATVFGEKWMDDKQNKTENKEATLAHHYQNRYKPTIGGFQ